MNHSLCASRARSGILPWSKKTVGLLMTAQAEVSQKHAKLLAGEPRFLRVNVTTSPGSYTLDSPREIEELAALGNREAEKPEVLGQVRSRFLNGVLPAPGNAWLSHGKCDQTQCTNSKNRQKTHRRLCVKIL